MDFDAFRGTPGNFRGAPGAVRGTPGGVRGGAGNSGGGCGEVRGTAGTLRGHSGGGGTQADLRTPQGEDYRRGIGDNGRTSHTPADP